MVEEEPDLERRSCFTHSPFQQAALAGGGGAAQQQQFSTHQLKFFLKNFFFSLTFPMCLHFSSKGIVPHYLLHSSPPLFLRGTAIFYCSSCPYATPSLSPRGPSCCLHLFASSLLLLLLPHERNCVVSVLAAVKPSLSRRAALKEVPLTNSEKYRCGIMK